MASILQRRPGYKRWWGYIQESARKFGMDPNETLATHIFENESGDPNLRGPIAKGKRAVGLAQIWDTRISRSTNSKGWALMAERWNLKDGQVIGDALKTNPEFAIDYMAWRMAGTRSKYKDVDTWYRSAYNPNFKGDARGPGPSIYYTENPTSYARNTNGPVFPVQGYGMDAVSSVWGDARDGGAREHKGVDIAAPRGTPLLAVEDGVVKLKRGGAGGNAIWINGKYYYAHLDTFKVRDGQRVKKGQVIGTVGSTGTSSSGPHLHFGIAPKGDFSASGWIDPFNWLKKAESGGGVVPEDGWDPGNDPDVQPEPDAFDFMFGGSGLPGGMTGPMLPGGGPKLPGTSAAEDFQRRDNYSQSWRLVTEQGLVSPETRRLSGNLADSEMT